MFKTISIIVYGVILGFVFVAIGDYFLSKIKTTREHYKGIITHCTKETLLITKLLITAKIINDLFFVESLSPVFW